MQASAADPGMAVGPQVWAAFDEAAAPARLVRYAFAAAESAPLPGAWLLSLLLRVAPLLLLHLTLTLQRLLALRRRLLIPRNFVELSRLLTHISLHLRQQLTLLIGQLIGIQHFTARRGFGWCTHAG